MAQRAEGPQHANGVNKAQGVDRAAEVQRVQNVDKAGKAELNKVRPDGLTTKAAEKVGTKAEASKVGEGMIKMMSDLEKGQGVLDSLIKKGLSGKQIGNTELLALQAQMYSYTQELELTGKVVEKATSGLKDTLKTQV